MSVKMARNVRWSMVIAAVLLAALTAGVAYGIVVREPGDPERGEPIARTLIMPSGVRVGIPVGFTYTHGHDDGGDFVRIGRGDDPADLHSYIDWDYFTVPPKVLRREIQDPADEPIFARIEADMAAEPPDDGSIERQDQRDVWLIPPDPPDPEEFPTEEEKPDTSDRNPGAPSVNWRTFPIASGEVTLPPGFVIKGPIESEYPIPEPGSDIEYPSGNGMAIVTGEPGTEGYSSFGWELESGRITAEYIAPELRDVFDDLERQVAAAYGLDERQYHPAFQHNLHPDAAPE